MINWTIPTLADVSAMEPTAQVKCVCGRVTFADSMHDIRPLPAHKRIHPADFVCAGCVSTMSREGISTREELVRGHSAPEHAIAEAKAHDTDMQGTIRQFHRHIPPKLLTTTD